MALPPLAASVIAAILPEVREAALAYAEKGLDILMDMASGEVSDERLLAFLRERAEGDTP